MCPVVAVAAITTKHMKGLSGASESSTDGMEAWKAARRITARKTWSSRRFLPYPLANQSTGESASTYVQKKTEKKNPSKEDLGAAEKGGRT